MFRNQYDTDVTVWSPQGRLHQVQYAHEAVNQVAKNNTDTSTNTSTNTNTNTNT